MNGIGLLAMVSGVSATFLGGALWIAREADKILRTETRDRLVLWLKGASSSSDSIWYETFTNSLDDFFGKRNVAIGGFSFTLLRLRRTALLSVFCVTALSVVYLAIHQQEMESLTHGYGIPVLTAGLVVAALFVNIPTDYISVMQTRWFLAKLNPARQGTRTMWRKFAFLLFADFFASAIIYFVLFTLLANVIDVVSRVSLGTELMVVAPASEVVWNLLSDFASIPSVVVAFFEGDGTAGLTGAFLLSTALTSVWLWIYIIGVSTVRLAGYYIGFLGWLNIHFEIDRHLERYPITFIVCAAIAIVSVFNVVGYVLLTLV
ncbi:hypothetical protein QMT40_001319 [Parvibaculaceae bacterium PLY_AMNH_Bact1]|nr:hypothetical protein QMT40_001319 [Parvibaculaceae bacterium PLY_AMNH_Bact1]